MSSLLCWPPAPLPLQAGFEDPATEVSKRLADTASTADSVKELLTKCVKMLLRVLARWQAERRPKPIRAATRVAMAWARAVLVGFAIGLAAATHNEVPPLPEDRFFGVHAFGGVAALHAVVNR